MYLNKAVFRQELSEEISDGRLELENCLVGLCLQDRGS